MKKILKTPRYIITLPNLIPHFVQDMHTYVRTPTYMRLVESPS